MNVKLYYNKDYIFDIELKNSIVQRDTMSQLLFVIALEKIIKELDTRSQN